MGLQDMNRKMKYIESGKVAKLPKKKIEDEEMKAAKLWMGSTDDEPTPTEMLESLRIPAEMMTSAPTFSSARTALDANARRWHANRGDGSDGEPEMTEEQHQHQLTAANALYMNWRNAYQQGINRNINCGSLRRIGKTHTLRRIIGEFRTLDAVRRIILLVPNMNYRNRYEDLYHNGTINVIIGNQNQLRGQANAYVFADEVPTIEPIPSNAGIEFIAGFYSR